MRTFKVITILTILLNLTFSCDSNEIEKDIEIQNTENLNLNLDELSGYHKYTQHLIVKVPSYLQNNADSLANWIITNQPGGLILNEWSLDNIQKLSTNLDSSLKIPPFILSSYWEMVQSKPYTYQKSNSELKQTKFQNLFLESGINMLDFEGEFDSIITSKQLFPIHNSYPTSNSNRDYFDFINSIQNTSSIIRLNISKLDSINYDGFKTTYNFKGLFIVESEVKNINSSIEMGADLVITELTDLETYDTYTANEITTKSLKQILSLKSKLEYNRKGNSTVALQKFNSLNLQQKGTALINNKNNLIPTNQINQVKVKAYNKTTVDKIINKKGTKYILLPDSLTSKELELFKNIMSKNKLVICYSNPKFYASLKNLPHLVFIPPTYHIDNNILKAQLQGNLSFEGNFVLNNQIIKGHKIKTTSLTKVSPEFSGVDAKKLNNIDYLIKNAMNGRSFPGCQIIAAKNGNIIFDKTYGHHTYDRKIPVTQNSVYDIASLTKIVSTTLMGMKLYEMNQYALNDSLEKYFPDTLKDYLKRPSTIRHITFQELFIHKSGLPSGFPILKYMQYTNTNIGRYDKYYCDTESDFFNTPVAENFYLEEEYQDSMWLTLHEIWINNEKPYKYSDVNMNTLYFLFKSIIQNNPKTFDFKESSKKLEGRNLYVEFLYKTFYKPLEMNSTMYQPLNKINKNRIVPTENESYWRKQLLQGYVHDPNSALHGGIAGNAGIFTTTNDLIKLLQMLINKGTYNNKQYLKPETIELFTSTQPETHRGLGFNKRTMTNSAYAMADSASVKTYGHTGFTGTCFWVDPDTKIAYVFLANRVHPKINNRMYQYAIRKNVHQVFYDAIID